MPGVVIHDPIRSADRAKAEIIAPAAQGSIEFFHHRFHRLPIGMPLRHPAEPFAEGSDPLPRGSGANVRPARLDRVALSQGVTEEVETFLRHPANPRLLFVDLQPQLAHDGLHLLSCLLRLVAAEDNEVISIYD